MPRHQPAHRPVHAALTLPEVRRRLTGRRTARHHRLNLDDEVAAHLAKAQRLARATARVTGQPGPYRG